jgi:hypothetical protein
MPRVSRGAQAISNLSVVLNNRVRHRAIRLCHDDDDSLEDMKDLLTLILLKKMKSRRYLFRASKYRKSPAVDRFKTDLFDGNEEEAESEGSTASELPWLSDDEFLQKYRVSRRGFQAILDLIKDHPVFESKTKTMAPPNYQLMVFLSMLVLREQGRITTIKEVLLVWDMEQQRSTGKG